jgi:hypothetical protein
MADKISGVTYFVDKSTTSVLRRVLIGPPFENQLPIVELRLVHGATIQRVQRRFHRKKRLDASLATRLRYARHRYNSNRSIMNAVLSL